MTQQPDPADAPPAPPALKIVEPKVDPDDPWGDDVPKRREIADRLTSIVRGQEAPFVISLDGRWGTGKTFLLKRWQQDLLNRDPKWEAIYFNEWEDDFNNDPLLAITGQLAEYFDEGALREIARGIAGALGHVLVKRVTGASPDELTPDSLLNDYQDGLRTKRAVKDRLEQLGAQVRADTGQPLVFIIDELDRCRPTFAIELLERVKHICDVPNIVSGINRGELMKSLESVYGEIDSGTYLRRFFDMEFMLPDADPRRFCTHLLSQYRLPELFRRLGTSVGTSRSSEIEAIAEYFPVLLGKMGLSLRDTDYCCRLLSLAAMDLAARYPLQVRLFLVLVAVKVKEPALYRRFVEGSARGADVINYLNRLTPAGVGVPESQQGWVAEQLERMHAAIYAADEAEAVAKELERLREGSMPDRPEYLSEEHGRLGQDDSASLTGMSGQIRRYAEESRTYGSSLGYFAELIDLYSGQVRR